MNICQTLLQFAAPLSCNNKPTITPIYIPYRRSDLKLPVSGCDWLGGSAWPSCGEEPDRAWPACPYVFGLQRGYTVLLIGWLPSWLDCYGCTVRLWLMWTFSSRVWITENTIKTTKNWVNIIAYFHIPKRQNHCLHTTEFHWLKQRLVPLCLNNSYNIVLHTSSWKHTFSI